MIIYLSCQKKRIHVDSKKGSSRNSFKGAYLFYKYYISEDQFLNFVPRNSLSE